MKDILRLTLLAGGLNLLFIPATNTLQGTASDSACNRIAGDSITITILYDNYIHMPGTTSDWGFACLIEGIEKTILFDTGAKGEILLDNMDRLKVDVTRIPYLFLSHIHSDHTGGIPSVRSRNPELTAFVPTSFPDKFDNLAGIKKIIRCGQPVEICKGVSTTGEMGIIFREQALVCNTKQGPVVITGCSHPGIVEIIKRVKGMTDQEIFLVIGGFHLVPYSDEEVKDIIGELKKLGIRRIGSTHCTGDKQISVFKEMFGPDFIGSGTGKRITITDRGIIQNDPYE